MALSQYTMNRYNKINLYKERANSFVKRTISMLELIDFPADYDKELHEFYDQLIESGCDGYDAADSTIDFSASLADEYSLLSDGIYSAVLTAFFHLWERDIKDLCRSLLRYRPVAEGNKQITEKDLYHFTYEKLKLFLVFMGAEESVFHDINILRLVVNTIKHSTGHSAAELQVLNSKYYYKLSMLCDLRFEKCPEYDEPAMLDIDDIKYFGNSLSAFWKVLGENINL